MIHDTTVVLFNGNNNARSSASTAELVDPLKGTDRENMIGQD
jgi:hypothetical protein